jgi:GntR family transcriptional regulator
VYYCSNTLIQKLPPEFMPTPLNIPFTVSPVAGIPIYQQLVEQITRMVASGQLSTDSVLPSVREVAVALAINPMTVSKAYSLLESQGVLERQRGVGMVVAASQSRTQTKTDRLNLLRPSLERVALEAFELDIPRQAAVALFDKILKGKK